MTAPTTKQPLAGVRVTDFTWMGAGSFATRLLADLGADVIKVESRMRLDTLRESKPFKDGIPGVNRSGYFSERNASKRSITLNMKSARAQELARALIAKSDIVANNFTPGTMEKFGLGYEDVRGFSPRSIYIAMSMQGSSGPEANYLGYGLTMGAVTGLHNLCGYPDRDPVGTGTNFPDHVPNPTHAAFAVLAALWYRRRTGIGQHIDLAQIEPTISLLGPSVLDFTANGHIAERAGNQHVAGAPHGVYPCAGVDRWIAIAATGDAQWRALVDVLGAGELGGDARFADPLGRWRHRGMLDGLIAGATHNWQAAELMHRLQANGVPAGVVNDSADVLRSDPQIAQRGQWIYLQHAEMGETVYTGAPFQLSRTPGQLTRPAPLLGEHTEQVCREELGLSESEIAALYEQGVLQ